KMGLKSYAEAEKKYLTTLQYAVDHGLRTRCHIEDTSRANYDFVYPFVEKLLEIDPDTILRICDTLGYGMPFPECGEPYGIPITVKKFKAMGVKHIELHVHDDFGMGVANTMAGFWYGADWASLTFLGVGERAGNTELEKILAFLITRVEGFEKYDLHKITKFADYMEQEIGIRIPRNKAIVGKNIFSHESGIHTAGIIKNPFTYEPFPPEVVGGKRNLMIGDTSGTEVIRLKVEEALSELLGINAQVDKHDQRIKCIHKEITKMYDADDRRSPVSDEEIHDFVRKYFVFHVDGEMIESDDQESSEHKPSPQQNLPQAHQKAPINNESIKVEHGEKESIKVEHGEKVKIVKKTPGKKK
ncbi:MAG TPA: LeuA family protein, partial [Methanocella sp.]|nr:LeuA family protein [Methanocella sp.]